MKSKNYLIYIEDMLESIKKGFLFVENISFEDFLKDEKTQFAVIRAIEIIGEASKKVPENIKESSPLILWKEIGGMRDKLIHDYFGVDLEIVWNTVSEDFPELKRQLEELYEKLKRGTLD